MRGTPAPQIDVEQIMRALSTLVGMKMVQTRACPASKTLRRQSLGRHVPSTPQNFAYLYRWRLGTQVQNPDGFPPKVSTYPANICSSSGTLAKLRAFFLGGEGAGITPY